MKLRVEILCQRRTVERHLRTFCHRDRKKVQFECLLIAVSAIGIISSECIRQHVFAMIQMPDMLNWFGWCTWDAFYTTVTSEGVKQGLER